MIDVSVVDSENLNFDAMVHHQREAFASMIKHTGTDYLFTESYYQWKYSPPAGNAKIALLKDEIGLVATNSMYPLDILVDGDRIRGWQSCDTATHPRGRSKGYFMKCLEALKAELGPEDLFFGFPNHNSMAGFLKFGWTHHSNIRTWLNILPIYKFSKFSAIEPINHFTEEQKKFSSKLGAMSGAMIDRSAAYMNWRYKQHPLHQYEIFGWRKSGHLLGIIILRRAKISGKKLSIVMETLALFPHVERGLLAFATKWAREHGATYTLALNNTINTVNGIMSAYVPIPMWFLPKRQILMGGASGRRAKEVWNKRWSVQIGDWDGF